MRIGPPTESCVCCGAVLAMVYFLIYSTDRRTVVLTDRDEKTLRGAQASRTFDLSQQQ